MKLGHEYDQSGVTVAVVLSLSPQPVGPAHPPETAMSTVGPMSAKLAKAPESAELAEAAAVAPPEAEPHQWQHIILQS